MQCYICVQVCTNIGLNNWKLSLACPTPSKMPLKHLYLVSTSLVPNQWCKFRNHGVWSSQGEILLHGEIEYLSFLQIDILHDFFFSCTMNARSCRLVKRQPQHSQNSIYPVKLKQRKASYLMPRMLVWDFIHLYNHHTNMYSIIVKFPFKMCSKAVW